MILGEHCDEIIRLIDEALGTGPPAGGPPAAPAPGAPAVAGAGAGATSPWLAAPAGR